MAELNSVSKAAEKLRIGQPTLSSQIQQFEHNLDIELFQRKHKKLILTEQGKVALGYAHQIFALGDEMLGVLKGEQNPSKLTLKLGALDSVPKQVITKLVDKASQVTACHIVLSEGKPEELLRALEHHHIDLLLMDHVPLALDTKTLFPKLISKKQVSFYGAKKHLSLKNNYPETLKKAPLILPTYDSRLRKDLDHWAQLNNVVLNPLIESQDISVKKLMAEEGQGIIATSEHAVESQLKRKELFKIGTVKGVFEELYLVSVRRKIENPVASQMMKEFEV